MRLKSKVVYMFLIILKLCSAKLEPKIVGGTKADMRDWPFIVFVVYSAPNSSGPACGGSLLSSQTVLTAAHCLDDPTDYKKNLNHYVITVLMGSSNIFKTTMYRKGIDYQTHDRYQQGKTVADIGILFLEKPVIFSNTVKKTVLLESSSLPSRSKLLAAGWGYWSVAVNKTHPVSEDLQVLDQLYIPHSECEDRVLELEEGTVCATSGDLTKFIYSGDSGGPLVTPEGFQLGLVSYKISNDEVTVYTSLPFYRKWIQRAQNNLYHHHCPGRYGH